MAKKVHKINNFEEGMMNDPSGRDIPSGSAQFVNTLDTSSYGKLKPLGRFAMVEGFHQPVAGANGTLFVPEGEFLLDGDGFLVRGSDQGGLEDQSATYDFTPRLQEVYQWFLSSDIGNIYSVQTQKNDPLEWNSNILNYGEWNKIHDFGESWNAQGLMFILNIAILIFQIVFYHTIGI
jgi:hypothetical protein